MSQILKLFKIQFDEKFDILKTGNKKKMIGAIIKYLLIIIALTIAFYTVFLKFVLLGFKTREELVSIVLLITQVISLLFAIGHTIKTLFQNKDNELLMSMPVSPNQVFVSKILFSYVQEVIINSFFVLPLLLSIGILGGSDIGFGVYFFLSMPFIIAILPLLPLSIALLLSIPVSYVLKFFKKHFIIATGLLLAFVVVMILLYVNLLAGITEGFNIASKQIETVKNINKAIETFGQHNYLYLWFAQGIMHISKIYWILLFIILSGSIFTLAFFVVKPFFFKLAMGNLENSVSVYREGSFKTNNKFSSLLKIEFLNVFRSPGTIFDYFLFVILMPFVVVVYDNLLLGMVVNQTGIQMINGSHVLIVAVFATLSNIYSASAISREGANFYIIKSSPISYYTTSFAKLTFNAIFSVSAIIITGIATCFYLDIGVAILTTFICIFLSLAHMFYSFDIDLKKPTLDWYDSGDIAKLNKNTTKSIISGILIALLSGLFIILLASTNLGLWSFVLLLILSIAFCLYKFYILILRIFYQYERLEP